MNEPVIDIRVNCLVVSEERAKLEVAEGNLVWTWCSRGFQNWAEPRVARADVIAYLLPDTTFEMPPDAEEYLPPEDFVDRKVVIHQLRDAYAALWGYAEEMNSPTLADLCEDPVQRRRAEDLMEEGMIWEAVAKAIGCAPGKEIAHDG